MKAVALSFLVFFFIVFAAERNEVVVSLIINGERKGDVFCILEDSKILIPLEDLRNIGIRRIGGTKLTINDKEYLDLSSWEDIKFQFDEKRLELSIILPPEYLPESTIDLYSRRRQNVIIPEQDSAFLNYRFDYSIMENRRIFSLNHELGIRFKRLTFLTSGFYSDNTNKYTRLETAVYLDDRKTLNRLVIGDFVTPSLPTTAGNRMAGLSYYKNFNIDPYFIYKPTFDIRIPITFPSEVEIYLDDTLIRREFVPPGVLNLQDLYYYGGRRDVKIVIKDPFGRIQTLIYPFYFTDIMLRKGVREFNYSLGFLREDYGIKGDRYTDLVFSLRERYGYSEYLTIGTHFTSVPAKKFYNIGGETIFLLGHYGVLSLYGSYSSLLDKSGFSLISSYSYGRRNFIIRTMGFYASDDYSRTYKKLTTEEIKRGFSIGAGYHIPSLGTINLDYIHNRYEHGEGNSVILGYTGSFKGKISVFAGLRRILGKGSETEFFVGVNLYPGREYIASTRLDNTPGRTAQVLQLSKIPPIGEGYGYRVSLERERIKGTIPSTTFINVNPYLQYRTKYGILEAEGIYKRSNEKLYESARFVYSGAIAFVDDTIGFTRPINNSFALVRVSDLSGVNVSLNGQPMGKTNKKGYLFVPNLSSYYDNSIAINDRDIPLEYDLLLKEIVVSPWYRSGFCLKFPVMRVYRYTGYLIAHYLDNGERKPLEFHEIVIDNVEAKEEKSNCITFGIKRTEKEIRIITGKNGEFYIEDLNPGVYKAKVKVDGVEREIELVLKESKELIIDLGVIEVPIELKREQKG